MKAKTGFILVLLLLLVQAAAAGPGRAAASRPITKELLCQNLYIGEVFRSGFIYIEPFAADRAAGEQAIRGLDYPERITFYPCRQVEQLRFFEAWSRATFNAYVPDTEAGSRYFSQPLSKPKQVGLRYRTHRPPARPQLGVAFFNLEVSQVDYTVAGQKRPYSDQEYRDAQNRVKNDRELNAAERTLDVIGLNDTIAGAKQLAVFYFNGTPLAVRLSEYSTHNFESAATVYVADVLRDGRAVKTQERYIWDGPY
jgi:hypothetical protein